MIFLNAFLLLGAAAFSIPLIIHLLNKSKFQTIDWGAMIFLEEAAKVNSRRVQWQTWLLLLLRCSIPIILAICMARPMLKNYFFVNGLNDAYGQQTASVLVIDNSLSMQAASVPINSKQSLSYSQQSKTISEDFVMRSSGNTRWAISTWEDFKSDVRFGLSRNKQAVREQLNKVDSRSGSFPFISQLDSAIDLVSKSPDPSQQIILVSDFQASSTQSLDPQSMATFREKLSQLPIKPRIVLIPIGDRPKASESETPVENLSITIDRNTQSLVGVGQAWELRARVKNHSSLSVANLPILIQVDGVSITTRRLDLPSNGESQLVVAFEFPTVGPHVVTAAIEHTEAVLGDNQASWSVLSIGSIPTLLVSDEVNDIISKNIGIADDHQWGDVDYITAALGYSPADSLYQTEKGTGKSSRIPQLYSLTKVSSQSCTPSMLDKNRLLVLANTSKLSDDCTSKIGEWIAGGGTLMLLPGDTTEFGWCNNLKEPLLSESPALNSSQNAWKQLLPFAYSDAVELAQENQTGETIRKEFFTHPSLRILNDSRWGTIDRLDIRKWLRMIPHEQKTVLHNDSKRFESKRSIAIEDLMGVKRKITFINQLDKKHGIHNSMNIEQVAGKRFVQHATESASTILSLSNGEPFLAIKQIGQGSVIQCAVSGGDQWSNWPMRPIYLPMIQQLLVGSTPLGRWNSNVQTGETLTLPTSEMLRWIASDWEQTSTPNQPQKSSQDLTQADSNSQMRVIRWWLPSENKHNDGLKAGAENRNNEGLGSAKENVESPPLPKLRDQITDVERGEGSFGQPAIIARQAGTYVATSIADGTETEAIPTLRASSKTVPSATQSSSSSDPPTITMCAQIPNAESDLRLASQRELMSIAEKMDAIVLSSVDEYLSMESGEGSEMWRWFLIALLGSLFGEILLQRYLSVGGKR